MSALTEIPLIILETVNTILLRAMPSKFFNIICFVLSHYLTNNRVSAYSILSHIKHSSCWNHFFAPNHLTIARIMAHPSMITQMFIKLITDSKNLRWELLWWWWTVLVHTRESVCDFKASSRLELHSLYDSPHNRDSPPSIRNPRNATSTPLLSTCRFSMRCYVPIYILQAYSEIAYSVNDLCIRKS